MIMKFHNQIDVQLVKWFYGIPGPLDEYARQQIDRIGNHAFIFLWTYTFFANLVIFGFAIGASKTVFVWTVVINELITILGVWQYTVFEISRKHLLDAEIKAAGARQNHRWAFYQALKSLVVATPIAYFIYFAINLAMGTETVSSFLLTLNYPVLSIAWGLAAGFITCFGRVMRTRYIK